MVPTQLGARMWKGWGFLTLLLAFFVLDSPFGAWVIYRLLGTSTVSYVSSTGMPAVMVLGPNAPQPDWAVLAPDGLYITGARSGPDAPRLETGSFDYVSWSDPAWLRDFYRKTLEGDGFVVTDEGTGPLNSATAQFLGIADMLTALDDATGREIRINIRTAQGWVFPGRYVQIVWARTVPGTGSAWPALPPSPPLFTSGTKPS